VSVVFPRSVAGTCVPFSRSCMVVCVLTCTHELNVRVVFGVVTVITPLLVVHVPLSVRVELPEMVQLQPPPLATQVLPAGNSDWMVAQPTVLQDVGTFTTDA
jgi:hypothetical protein